MKAERTVRRQRAALQALIESNRSNGDDVVFRTAQAMRIALEWAEGRSSIPLQREAVWVAKAIRSEMNQEAGRRARAAFELLVAQS